MQKRSHTDPCTAPPPTKLTQSIILVAKDHKITGATLVSGRPGAVGPLVVLEIRVELTKKVHVQLSKDLRSDGERKRGAMGGAKRQSGERSVCVGTEGAHRSSKIARTLAGRNREPPAPTRARLTHRVQLHVVDTHCEACVRRSGAWSGGAERKKVGRWGQKWGRVGGAAGGTIGLWARRGVKWLRHMQSDRNPSLNPGLGLRAKGCRSPDPRTPSLGPPGARPPAQS